VSGRPPALVVLLGALGFASNATPALAGCAPKIFDSAKFTVCAFDPRHDDIRLFLSGPDDKPYGSLAALAAALRTKGQSLVFAMNAGMFREDLSPVGLYVENRKKLHDADNRGGATNFHMKPNGVFWVGDEVAGIAETSRFLAAAAARRPSRPAIAPSPFSQESRTKVP